MKTFPVSSIQQRGGLGLKTRSFLGRLQHAPLLDSVSTCRQRTSSRACGAVRWSHFSEVNNRPISRRDGTVGSNGRDGKRSRSSLQARALASSSDSLAAQPPPIMVNSVTGKMGLRTAQAVVAAGLTLVPFTLVGSSETESVDVKGVNVRLRQKSERDAVLDEVLRLYPNVVMVDYTAPQAVNDNAEFYCRRGVPFVMGTTGGDREKLMNDVLNSGTYAVIAPQMGKQVVAFQAAMQIMSEQFPGAFSGYKLQVTESHQSSKVDTSGTAKAIVGSFVKLGLDYDVSQIEKIRNPAQQMDKMKVPLKHLRGHAFHTYRIESPDETVSFEFKHNVCERSIYAEGTVDAVLFLAKKVAQATEKKVYDMIDVLREGNMR